MKNNTSESKVLLEKTLRSLPIDHVLQGARYHLKCALNEIQKVEGKRQNREVVRKTSEEEHKAKMGNFFITPDIAQAVLDGIDNMIDEEQTKIENMKKKSEKQTSNETFTD